MVTVTRMPAYHGPGDRRVVLTPSEQPPILDLQWQDGPAREHGHNGCQVREVLGFCLERLEQLNTPPYQCAENDLAIDHVRHAVRLLEVRERARSARGVEGTAVP